MGRSRLLITLMLLLTGRTVSAQSLQPIPFTLLESGHIIMRATFDGVTGNFIFDTGGGHNLLFDRFAEQLGKSHKTHHFFTAHRATGEALTVPVYEIDSLRIGNLVLTSQVYSTFDMDIEGIDGILSLQPFEHTPVTIDFENRTLSFDPLTEAQKQAFIDIQVADYAGKALDIFTNVRVNDTLTIQVLLDSGAGNGSFWFSTRLMDALKLNKNTFEETERQSEFDAGRIDRFYRGPLQALATEGGQVRLQNFSALFVDGLIYEGKTGIDWLGKQITISIPDRRIYLLAIKK
ncbi:retropepsin-like aspartic protease [Parapedobacter lycopersici]|uniref:retropepsin-like aspartic protease n=1 Tax=Parapedobacter lycopersici TaxID=1864939 RepID=UPI003340E5D8